MVLRLILALLLTGCVGTTPKAVKFCNKNETVDCRPWTPGDQNGASQRGHSEDVKETP